MSRHSKERFKGLWRPVSAIVGVCTLTGFGLAYAPAMFASAAPQAALSRAQLDVAMDANPQPTGSTEEWQCVNGTGQIAWVEVSQAPHTCADSLNLWHVGGGTGTGTGPAGPAGPKGATGAQGPAGPAGAGVLPYRTEVDNGAEYAVSVQGSLGDTSSSTATYSDAGIIVDDGLASSLTESDFSFTASKTIAENVWIGNGPQAATDGIYPLASTDFCYGLGTDLNSSNEPQSFEMQSKCGSFSNTTLTLAQVAADFPGMEAYTWGGVTTPSPAAAVSPVSITALAGKTGLTVTTSIGDSSGVLTPSVQS